MKTILVDAWNTFVTEEWVFVAMKKMLDTFENRKIIVTNANPEERVKYGIVDMPYEVFSLEHNPNKPDPQYFVTLMNHYNLTPSEIIYFEHNPEAVQAAKSVWINVYHYDKDAKDLDTLEKFIRASIE